MLLSLDVSTRMMNSAAVLAILAIAGGLSSIDDAILKANDDQLVAFRNVDVRHLHRAFKVAGRSRYLAGQ